MICYPTYRHASTFQLATAMKLKEATKRLQVSRQTLLVKMPKCYQPQVQE